MHRIFLLFLVVVMTIFSGIADSRGFVHAAKVWKEGSLVFDEILKSAAGYGVGIFFYWWVIKYLNEFGVVAPELQTLGWFAVVIIGVAITSGNFGRWQLVDQIVAITVVLGIGWLTLRTGG